MEVEQEAKELGWTPKETFRGDPEKWVDAATYVERGHQVMPILRKNNEKLLGTVAELTGKVKDLTTALTETHASMGEFKKFQEEATATQVAKARRDLLANLKAAKESDDVDAEVEAAGELSAFDAATLAAKSKPTAAAPASGAPSSAPVVDPEVSAWMGENLWYGKDQERTGMAIGVANRLRAEGSTKKGRAFLEEVASVVEDRLGPAEGQKTPAASKVEGAQGGGGSRSGAQDYASLPADARAVCDKQAEKFVGANKVFKTAKEWNTHYATQYYKGA